ncbi:MAG: glycerol acyltransferase [Bacteroidetes bacterium]|jgi:putative hemolysin|nr:glycerol acyltransferase [Bacteroidota bacterium]MBT6686652.1 glycerol acyltransferase [Bacteroidota bacterium]MBT7144838.1 glycerol acyltransferase [Bacteroidota bacterium]MBT7490226.1 glycerol acyltransferase [Bacteroidota bacterium]
MTKFGEDIKYIDIAKIIDESNSEVLNKLPGFVVKWIAKIIRQDELNRIFSKYSDYTGVDFLPKIIEEYNLKLEIEGKENLPENGKCFFVANHPFGVIDGLVLTHTVSEKYGKLKAIANEAFMFVPQLRPLIAAVNVFGRSSREYIKALDETYKMEIPITHFPAGIVSRLYKGKVQDLMWKKSFITKANSSKRDIVPFYFYGRNSCLFYMVYLIRQLFGIKINLELLLLPYEMFKKRNKTIKVKIGKPMSYHMFDKSTSHLGWAQKVRSHVYELGNNKSKNNF